MTCFFKKREPRKCIGCKEDLNPNHYAPYQIQCIFCKASVEQLVDEYYARVKAERAVNDAIDAAWERNR